METTERTKRTARAIFANMGPNFMTPYAIEFGWAGDLAYEISEGSDFDHQPMFGVTFRESDGSNSDRACSLSRLFGTLEDARTHARNPVTEEGK